MVKKRVNYRECYSIKEHALEMFKENYEFLISKTEPFDILPFSDRYYTENIECFGHQDRNEVSGFIRELISLGFIRLHDKAFNIVVITERGHSELSTWKIHWDRIYGRI